MDGVNSSSSSGSLDKPRKSSKKLVIFIIGVVFFLVFWGIFWLNFFGFISVPLVSQYKVRPQQSDRGHGTQQVVREPQAIIRSAIKLDCSITKEGNPLVDGEVQKLEVAGNHVVVGTFRGNINKYDYFSATKTASLELIAPQGDQSHDFSLKEERGLVYDAIGLKDLTLADLKVGETVVISFNCFPDKLEGEQFKITRVAITGK